LDKGTFPGGRFTRSKNLHTKILGQLGQRSPSSCVIYIHRLAIHGDWMKVYIDESGNLGGLGSKISEEDPYFILAALITGDDLPIKRCIREVRLTLKKKHKVKSELKFNQSSDPSKRRILECVAKTNSNIAYIFCTCLAPPNHDP
jgi:hypothetical protein